MIDPTPCGKILPDMKDLPFYEAALNKQISGVYLITDNKKHFPNESFVVTPREFLDDI